MKERFISDMQPDKSLKAYHVRWNANVVFHDEDQSLILYSPQDDVKWHFWLSFYPEQMTEIVKRLQDGAINQLVVNLILEDEPWTHSEDGLRWNSFAFSVDMQLTREVPFTSFE
jgi:hypothetical protein